MATTTTKAGRTGMSAMFRWLIRVMGFVLIVLALYPFWRALTALDRREYVSAGLSAVVGWLLLQAGVEFVRPESAE